MPPLPLDQLFCAPKPIVAMVHLQYGGDLKGLIDDALRDVERLERGGVDGLLFENWGEGYRTRHVPPQVRSYIEAAITEASRHTRLPYGLNVLPLDYEATFELAARTRARFVQLDTLVDTVRTDYESRFIIKIAPGDVMEYRKRARATHIALFANIQTKHYQTLPANKKLETSAHEARNRGVDAIVVTGPWTGKPPTKETVLRVKRVADDVPVLIGSGLDIESAQSLLGIADGAIVGSGLKYGGITENPVDEDRVKRFMDAVRRASK